MFSYINFRSGEYTFPCKRPNKSIVYGPVRPAWRLCGGVVCSLLNIPYLPDGRQRTLFLGDSSFLCPLAFSITQSLCYNHDTMAQQLGSVTITSHQPLIGIPFEENGQEVVRYFSEEALADQAVSTDATQDALNLAGAWSDLDFDETLRQLDHIRHDTPPTPPIELDL